MQNLNNSNFNYNMMVELREYLTLLTALYRISYLLTECVAYAIQLLRLESNNNHTNLNQVNTLFQYIQARLHENRIAIATMQIIEQQINQIQQRYQNFASRNSLLQFHDYLLNRNYISDSDDSSDENSDVLTNN